MLPNDLKANYEKTILEIDFGGIWKLLGHTSFTGHVITAWNPKSREYPIEDNLTANQHLKELLMSMNLTLFSCIGHSPDYKWQEEHFAVEGLTDLEAVEIGRLFIQNAIFKCTMGRTEILDCTD